MFGFIIEKFRRKKEIEKKQEESALSKLKRYNNIKTLRFSAPFIKLFAILLKNYKLLVRSKISVLVFLFGPLLIIFLVSLGFNTSSLMGLNIATYSEAYSPMANNLMNNLTKDFTLSKVDSKDKCLEAVKFAEASACLIFPKNMAIDNIGDVITIYVDNSRMNLANSIVEKLNSNINIQSKGISSGLVSQLLGTLSSVQGRARGAKTYLDDLKKKNQKNQNLVNSLNSAFDNVDLSYGSDNLNDALNEISRLKSKWNLTSSAVLSVKNEVYTMHSRYSQLTSKMDSAKQYINSLKSESASIKTSISQSISPITQVEDVLNKIDGDVNGIKITNIEGIVMPVKTKVEPLSLKKTYFFYTIPLLLTILFMFVSIFMSSITIVRERKSIAYFRNFITPTFDGLFVIAHYLTFISIILVQLIAVLGFASQLMPTLNYIQLIYIGIILSVLASLFIFMGMFLGFSLNTGESVTLSAISISTVLLVFSNAILPTEALTETMRKIVAYNPVVISENVLKRIILFGSGYGAITRPLIYLGAWVLVLGLLSFITAELTKRMRYS